MHGADPRAAKQVRQRAVPLHDGNRRRHPRRVGLVADRGEAGDRRRARLLQDERDLRGDKLTANVWHFGVHAEDVGQVRLRRETVGHAAARGDAQVGSGPFGGVAIGVPDTDDPVVFGEGVPVQRQVPMPRAENHGVLHGDYSDLGAELATSRPGIGLRSTDGFAPLP